MKAVRLGMKNIKDLMELSQKIDFPCSVDKAKNFCNGKWFKTLRNLGGVTQMYGMYDGKTLIAVLTATYSYIFPTGKGLSGRVVELSGAYVVLGYRHHGIITHLARCVERDAREWKADYICLDDKDSTAVYDEHPFEPVVVRQREWKALIYEEGK